MAAVSNSITKKEVGLYIHCKENVRPTNMLQCCECKSQVYYECTELPTYTIASLENSQRRFSCKYCVEIPYKFLEKMKQISSSRNSSDNSSKANLNTLLQLQSQLEYRIHSLRKKYALIA